MFLSAIISLLTASTYVTAASSSITICTSTQCLQGNTNMTLGATLSSPSISSSILLLPDTYASSSSLPSELLAALQSPLSTLALPTSSLLNASSSSTISLPLTILPSSALISFQSPKFTNGGVASSVPQNNESFAASTINLGSMILTSGVWAVLSSPSDSSRVVVWDSIPDFSQFPVSSAFAKASSASLSALQSSSCSTPCSSAGTCTTLGVCTCPLNFSGSACETCAKGFFGPDCKACPANCPTCDDGPTGSGLCLSPIVSNPPASCNCVHGTCSSDGSCACSPGWASGSGNSTACSICSAGFFDNGDGECRKCALGCDACASGTGTCTQCKSGLVPNSSDLTKCISSAGTTCADGTYNNAGTCSPCSSLCKTCTGPSSSECSICGAGRSSLNGSCVTISTNGVCTPDNVSTQNSTMIANNAKNECDTCPSTCTTCEIPNFSIVSTISQVQCTGCLPGYVLSGGKCVPKCPDGTFVDPKGDGLTCVACDSSCGTCAGSKTFCLTCAKNSLVAQDGACVSSCPSTSFSSSGACLACHADCATCSGSGFDKCSSCPPTRPVLSSTGRCLMTCGRTEYFDSTSGGTGACKSCDSSCASCAASGSAGCLSCPTGKILQGGTCVDALCSGGSDIGIVKSLGGMCLSNLVSVASISGGATTTALSTVSTTTGTATPTATQSQSASGNSTGLHLPWWQILLIAAGVASIFVLALLLWRHKARKARRNDTQAFKESKLDTTKGWRGWFGFGSSRGVPQYDGVEAARLREVNDWKYEMERMEKGEGRVGEYGVKRHSGASSYSDFTSPSSPRLPQRSTSTRSHPITEPSAAPSFSPPRNPDLLDVKRTSGITTLSAPSQYSQAGTYISGAAALHPRQYAPVPPMPERNLSLSMSGGPSAIPQPRQPIKDTLTARGGEESIASMGIPHQPLIDVGPPSMTGVGARGAYWMNSGNRNPFRM